MTALENSISLTFETSGETTDEDDYDETYGAITTVTAKVFLRGILKPIGTISGLQVNRQKIPPKCFWETFDAHSASLEWVGGLLLENRYGRTTLQSLSNAGDDPEFFFFLVERFFIDDQQPIEVATIALRKFLHSEHIKGRLDYGCWCVSSMAYVLSEFPNGDNEARSQSSSKRKRGDDDSLFDSYYREIIPFLRNGFFREEAVVNKDAQNASILVGGKSHFEQDLKSVAEAKSIARSLLKTASANKKLSGYDADILGRVETVVNESYERSFQRQSASLSKVMIGASAYKPPEDCTSEEQLRCLKKDLIRLQSSGGSIARSTALHKACGKNCINVVRLLVQLDPSSTTFKNHLGQTPLIVAAMNASGRLSINGIDDTGVIDILLASGANKADVDSTNMTAYGHFSKSSKIYLRIMHYQSRHKVTDLEHKLYPPGGPTVMDFAKGKGGTSGFVDYGPEDTENDSLMARKDDNDY